MQQTQVKISKLQLVGFKQELPAFKGRTGCEAN